MAGLAVVTVVCLGLVTLAPGQGRRAPWRSDLTVGAPRRRPGRVAAHLSVDPGPDLHFDWGAVLGCAALVAAVGCAAVGTYAAVGPRRVRRPG